MYNDFKLEELHPLQTYLNAQHESLLTTMQDLTHAIYLMHHLPKNDIPAMEITNVCSTLRALEQVLMEMHRERLQRLALA